MPRDSVYIRQALFGPQGSIELSISHEAFLDVGKTLRSHAGKSGFAFFVFEKTIDESYVEEVRRSLTSAGFFVHDIPFETLLLDGNKTEGLSGAEAAAAAEEAAAAAAAEAAAAAAAEVAAAAAAAEEEEERFSRTSRSYQVVVRLAALASQRGIGSSDVFVAMGDEAVLNATGSAAGLITGKPHVAYVPTTYTATLLSGALKAHFSIAEITQKIEVTPHISFLVADPELLRCRLPQEIRHDKEIAFAYMVKAAFIDSKNVWDSFLESIDELASSLQEEGDAAKESDPAKEEKPTKEREPTKEGRSAKGGEPVFFEALGKAARSLSFVQNASALATRTNLAYANLFSQTFCELVPTLSAAQAIGEALRLSALLGVTQNGMPVRYLIEQDAALETLGILKAPEKRRISASSFEKKMKEIARGVSREVFVPLPFAPGRLSYSAFPEEIFQNEFEAFTQEES